MRVLTLCAISILQLSDELPSILTSYLLERDYVRLLSTCRRLRKLKFPLRFRLEMPIKEFLEKVPVSILQHYEFPSTSIDSEDLQFLAFYKGIPQLCERLLPKLDDLRFEISVDDERFRKIAEYIIETDTEIPLTPLQMAAISGNRKVVEMLLSKVEVDDYFPVIVEEDGKKPKDVFVLPPLTPFVLSVIYGHLKLAQLLHRRGAKTLPVETHGDARAPSYPMEAAITSLDDAMFEWLRSLKLRVGREQLKPLMSFVLEKQKDSMIEYMLDQVDNVYRKPQIKVQLFEAACKCGNLSICERLLSQISIDPDQYTTLLIQTMKRDKMDTFLVLINDKNFLDLEVFQKLDLISYAEDESNPGYFCHLFDKFGYQLLKELKKRDLYELASENLRVVKFLTMNGIEFDPETAYNLLLKAVEEKEIDAIKMLIRFNPQLHPNRPEWHRLFYDVKKLSDPTLYPMMREYQMEYIQNVLQERLSEAQLFLYMAKAARSSDVDELWSWMILESFDFADRSHMRLFTECLERGRTGVCYILLDCGHHLDAVDETGETLLHKAVKNNQLFMCNYLLAHGLKVNQKDYNHATPITYAKENGEAYQLLKGYGGKITFAIQSIFDGTPAQHATLDEIIAKANIP
ncbi:ankyrin repeat-containing domain protein [Gorgonomyces haynaldii]|nr:ankyrin repeat-containing domain protein [Gorgonomyces haynaldii]